MSALLAIVLLATVAPSGGASLDRAPLPLEGLSSFTLSVKLQGSPPKRPVPIMGARTPSLVATAEGVRFTLHTTRSDEPPTVFVPWSLLGARERTVLVRWDHARLDLFVDGVWVDEDFPLGDLQVDPGAVLAAAFSDAWVRGHVRALTVWPRALDEGERQLAAGGAGVVERARPAIERALFGPPDQALQYWRPTGFNVGDTFPYFHDGVFHFLYLRDRRHHRSKNKLGAHQWAHATSRDLVHWQHRPLAIGITSEAEGSICTGSVFTRDGRHLAFHAVRNLDRSERLALATSTDGVSFTKDLGFVPPPPLGPHFRDPFVFPDPTLGFVMFVTSHREGQGGVLARFASADLRAWRPLEPLVIGGPPPECPDRFDWNGWSYLVYSHDLRAHYRMAPATATASPSWQIPPSDGLGDAQLRVMKTAPFGANRRIGTAWTSPREWGGRAVFRELVQEPDGTLGTTFVPEMLPPAEPPRPVRVESSAEGHRVRNVPAEARLRFTVEPDAGGTVKVWLRASGRPGTGVSLMLDEPRGVVTLGDRRAEGLRPGSPHSVHVVMTGDIVDVSVDDRRTVLLEGVDAAGPDLVIQGARSTPTVEVWPSRSR